MPATSDQLCSPYEHEFVARKGAHLTIQYQGNEIRLEAQLAELASKNPKVAWLLDEYYSTETHADTALKYVLKHGRQCGYILPDAVRLETQPTAFMNAYATRNSDGMPFIYVNDGLPFFLLMLNYSLAGAAFKNAVWGGQSMSATLFTIMNGYWPPGVNLLSEVEAMGGFSEDERHFITAWLPAQMFFVVAHEFAHHLIWGNQQDPSQVHTVRLLTGKEIEVYSPSQKDEFRADEIAFDIWNELDSPLSCDFQSFTAGGLGALFGYFRILEEYTLTRPSSPDVHPPAIDRYERLRARLCNTGRVRSLRAMEETWAVTEIMRENCMEPGEILQQHGLENLASIVAKGEDLSNTCA